MEIHHSMISNGRWTVCCWSITDIANGWVNITQVITGVAPLCRLSYFSWDRPNCGPLSKWGLTQTSDSELKRTNAFVWFVSGGVPKSFTNTTGLRSSDGSLSGFKTGAQRLSGPAGTWITSSTCHNTIIQAFACVCCCTQAVQTKDSVTSGMVDAKAPGAHAWKDDAAPNHGTRSTKTRASKTNQVELNRPQHIERRAPVRFGIGTIDRMFSSQPTAGLLLWGHACVFRRVRDDSRSHNQVDGTKEVQDHSAPGIATGCWQDSL